MLALGVTVKSLNFEVGLVYFYSFSNDVIQEAYFTLVFITGTSLSCGDFYSPDEWWGRSNLKGEWYFEQQNNNLLNIALQSVLPWESFPPIGYL